MDGRIMEIYAWTERALGAGETDALLLGEGDYAGYPRRSTQGLRTNPVLVLRDGLYPYAAAHPEARVKEAVEACLSGWGDYLLGLVTSALVLGVEARFANTGRAHLGVDLPKHADALRESIRRHRPALRLVKEFGGRDFPDGALGYLRYLSLFCEREKGPAYFPPEIRITVRPRSSRPPFGHLDPLVETLLAAGNKRAHPELFLPDNYHWTCFLKRPIDFELVRRTFDLPPSITLEEERGSIFDSQGFIEITGGRDFAAKSPAWSTGRVLARQARPADPG
jgi:hypothetical protein